MNSISDNDLILKAQKGDEKAFCELIYRYDKKALAIITSYRNDEDTAKDIYQEVFLRVYRGLKNFRFESEFSTWLYRITVNVCITFKEREKRNRHLSIDEEFGGGEEDSDTTLAEIIAGDLEADEETLSSELRSQIDDAIETLSPKQKMAFTLKYFQELKIREIAKLMNCTDGAVKKYLFIATNKLKEELSILVK
jgi:RNA polymerase sigma-70 factor (ECF subfamily)